MTVLPARIPKKAKRASRWRSYAHTKFVGEFACSNCGFMPGAGGRNQAAHVRIGGQAGMGQKDHDWRTVSLCHACHDEQHRVGEKTFWKGRDVEALIAAFIKASPKRAEIESTIRERERDLG